MAKAMPKPSQGDRKSKAGKGLGGSKKQGGGGKFTWGSLLTNGGLQAEVSSHMNDGMMRMPLEYDPYLGQKAFDMY